MDVAVIILNYRRAELTIECLKSLAGEMSHESNVGVVVVDNGSDDNSAKALESAIDIHSWQLWCQLVKSSVNLGFAGGNNLGIRSLDAKSYLLLNSDTRVTPGVISILFNALHENNRLGAVGPRLQDVDGNGQISCFRYRTPLTELLTAASTGPLDQLFHNRLVPMELYDEAVEAEWLSFACIMIRAEAIRDVGSMDEGFFMYFEDIDYSRRLRKAGWRILYQPEARVIHLRGGTSSVKSAMKARTRIPRYYYEARSRYFAKYYGGLVGLWVTNLMWLFGRSVSLIREVIQRRPRSSCQREALDNWTNWLTPFRHPAPQRGGEM